MPSGRALGQRSTARPERQRENARAAGRAIDVRTSCIGPAPAASDQNSNR